MGGVRKKWFHDDQQVHLTKGCDGRCICGFVGLGFAGLDTRGLEERTS